MSHVASIKCVVKDLDALEEACKGMGLEFVRGQQTFKWYGRWLNDYDASDAAYHSGIRPEDYGKCEHAIRIPKGERNRYGEAYEVGVVSNPKGEGYVLLIDFFDHQITEAVGGKGCERLTQTYAAKVGIKQAKRDGWRVFESLDQNGNIVVTCKR